MINPLQQRRDFIRLTGLSALGLQFSRMPAMAGPFTREDMEKLVPVDKKLSSEWVKSLFARGTPEIWTGEQLKYIGMPIGGICAGQLYLGGDGRLWHWDIFNQHVKTGAGHYAQPMLPSSPVEQGFTLTMGDAVIPLEKFSSISFRGEYPFGIVDYREQDVAVTLEAFSPFIPLNTDDSSLPATVMRFTVKNSSRADIELTLTGTLENAVCLYKRSLSGTRRNRIVADNGLTFLECSAETTNQALKDFGTMGLALLGPPPDATSGDTTRPLADKLVGSLGRTLKVAAGQSEIVTFVLTWHFPNLTMTKLPGGRYYARKFRSALDVAKYVADNFDRLYQDTKLWRDTWYDSTLPYWFLDRTMLNTSILASSTCYRFKNGRFYGWEGVGCCPGTCGHVWHYAHAVARLFPDLERDTRARVDFGLALKPDGAILFRAEYNTIPAIDGQAGAILRALREHQMTADNTFLKKNWPGIKRATQWLIDKDGYGHGLIAGKQHNTLDADWFGPVAWLSGLYLAALKAAAAMADAMQDTAFATLCREISTRGQKNIVAQLFDGEYFINKLDPNHLDAINSGTGCEIDQVMGQSWAWQVGLGRVFPEKEARSALRSLWKYNFSPDVGPFREVNKPGRWYAMPGEAGLLMCTFPRKDWSYEKSAGKGKALFVGYFNECMNGFEYQVASHMIWEGLVQEGLAVTRAVHDRYSPNRRNPYNEVECGDHYARSMASYGVYLAACGFEYDGPKQHIGFAPRLTPENFKAAFTSAEGWGTAKIQGQKSTIQVRWGNLHVKTIALATTKKSATVQLNGQPMSATSRAGNGRLLITLTEPVTVAAGQALEVQAA